jgi:hypothetical protein
MCVVVAAVAFSLEGGPLGERLERDRGFADSQREGFEPSVPREREKERGSTKVAESGSVPGSLAHYGLVGVSGTTAGTPSGLMLKARKVRGSLPGFTRR